MERCYGDLFQLPLKHRKYFLNLMMDVVNGLEYISDQNKVHSDIKPGNILLKQNGDETWTALIADFGLSSAAGGTPIFMAPEGLTNRQLGKTDIYSLGITMLVFVMELDLALKFLYLPIRRKRVYARGCIESLPIINTIRLMIAADPEDRPSFRGIRQQLEEISPTYTGRLIDKHGFTGNLSFLNPDEKDAADAQLSVNLKNRKNMLQESQG